MQVRAFRLYQTIVLVCSVAHCDKKLKEKSQPTTPSNWGNLYQTTAEIYKLAGTLNAPLSQHHLSGFEIARLGFHPLH